MAGVQIIGKTAIIDTYNECGYEAFAILSGKTFIAGSGTDELSTWIDRFCPPGVSGSFTLQVYDCACEEVRKNTDYVTAFNCRITDMYGAGVGGFTGALTKRVEELEKKKEDPEKEDRISDAFIGMLEEPEKLLSFVGAIKGLLDMASPVEAAPAAMGAVTPKILSPGELTQSEEERYRRLAKALDTLEKRDPKIVEHLEKLSVISENKPDTFNMLITMLGNY